MPDETTVDNQQIQDQANQQDEANQGQASTQATDETTAGIQGEIVPMSEKALSIGALTAEELDDVLTINKEVFGQLLDDKGLAIISKESLGKVAIAAQRELSPNERLTQHMATYNPGVTHEMKGTRAAVADVEVTEEEPTEDDGRS